MIEIYKFYKYTDCSRFYLFLFKHDDNFIIMDAIADINSEKIFKIITISYVSFSDISFIYKSNNLEELDYVIMSDTVLNAIDALKSKIKVLLI